MFSYKLNAGILLKNVKKMQYWEQNTAKKEQKPRESTPRSHHSVEKGTVEIYSGLHTFFSTEPFFVFINLPPLRSQVCKRGTVGIQL